MEDGARASRNHEDSERQPAATAGTRIADAADCLADRFASRRPWAGIIANRSSGSGRGLRLVHQLAAELEDRGIDSRVAWTPKDRHELVGTSADDASCRCLVAAGGDGTVAALLNEKPSHPIAILPAGTENLTAAHFRHRRNVHSLVATIVEGHCRPVDLGLACGRRFMLMAGFGFDGDVVSRHHRGRLGSSGRVLPTNRAAYVEPILKSSLSYKFPVIRVRIDDPIEEEILIGTTVFLFNLPRYALGLPFAPEARDDDGRLDLLVFRKPGPFQALYYLWRVLWGKHLDDPDVIYRRVRRVTLSADDTVPAQLDGDPAGVLGPAVPAATRNADEPTTDPTAIPSGAWTVEVLPGAVQVLVAGRSRPSGLKSLAVAKDAPPR
jgi:diacylglycerol kinase family enzyme